MGKNRVTFRQFWELSEVYTAPLNLFIILLGSSAAVYLELGKLNWTLALFSFIMIAFHIATNIFNNWMDYRNAQDAYYKAEVNIIGRDQLQIQSVKRLFWIWMVLSFVLGAYLVWVTSWWIALIGVFGFYLGLFYSYGKYPINSLPIAESVTALASGFLIPFIAAYLIQNEMPQFRGHDVLTIFMITLPLVLTMFCNLLANNTCDLEEDVNNHRFTLVYYLGKESAVHLLVLIFAFIAIWLAVLVWLGLAPLTVLLLLIFLPFTVKPLTKYTREQDKKATFPLVLKVMSGVMVGYPLLYGLGTFLVF